MKGFPFVRNAPNPPIALTTRPLPARGFVQFSFVESADVLFGDLAVFDGEDAALIRNTILP
jgi:hypothetical protein